MSDDLPPIPRELRNGIPTKSDNVGWWIIVIIFGFGIFAAILTYIGFSRDNEWDKEVKMCHQVGGFVDGNFCVRSDHTIIAEMDQL